MWKLKDSIYILYQCLLSPALGGQNRSSHCVFWEKCSVTFNHEVGRYYLSAHLNTPLCLGRSVQAMFCQNTNILILTIAPQCYISLSVIQHGGKLLFCHLFLLPCASKTLLEKKIWYWDEEEWQKSCYQHRQYWDRQSGRV